MNHVLNLSYGKDSIACIGAIQMLGWKLDRIVHVEVMATPTTPAEFPDVIEFKKYADEKIFGLTGLKVEHWRSEKSYEEQFYSLRVERKTGKKRIYGFPMHTGNWCNSELKRSVFIKSRKPEDIVYIGIAKDEQQRFHNLNSKKISPLVEAGWSEKDCFDWCKKRDLLSPVYNNSKRGGCWFCHNQSIDQLRYLKINYPEYWKLMLKWDNDSEICFTSYGKTLHDFDERFDLEKKGLVPKDGTFRWSMIEQAKREQLLF